VQDFTKHFDPHILLKTKGSNIEKFHDIMRDLESPDSFITWNYLYLVASCLGRRVWIGNDYPIYPNIFLMFIADPGFGKSLPAKKGTQILKKIIDVEIKDGIPVEKVLVKTSPDSVTLEALWMELANAVERIKICDNPPRFYIHSSVSFCLGDEMGTLFRDKTNDLVTFLTQAWDCSEFFHRKTKAHGEVTIVNMCVNLLGCATPEWVSRNFQTALISEGFAARVIFIHGDKPRHRKSTLDDYDPDQREKVKEITKHLKGLAKIPPGAIDFSRTGKAFAYYDKWVHTKMDHPINTERKLKDYYSRKRVHLQKIATLMHFAEKTTMQLDEEDFIKAEKFLEATEVNMHLALRSSGRNPINNLAQEILRNIENSGGKQSRSRIILDHFSGGNMEEIEAAILFLKDSGQIRDGLNNNLTYYYKMDKDNYETQ
jgi:hypothetical protein